MINIELMVDGKKKTYRAANVTLRTSYEAYRLYREYTECQGDYTDELLERCERMVCRIFGDAFTPEQLLDGYRGSAFRLFPGMLNAIVSYSNEQIANFPGPPATAAEKTKAKA